MLTVISIGNVLCVIFSSVMTMHWKDRSNRMMYTWIAVLVLNSACVIHALISKGN